MTAKKTKRRMFTRKKVTPASVAQKPQKKKIFDLPKPVITKEHVLVNTQPSNLLITPHDEGRIEEKKQHIPWLRIVVFLLLFIVGIGIIVFTPKLQYVSSITSSFKSPTPTLKELRFPTFTPTPTSIDASKFKIRILNGSGLRGEAGKVQDLLEKDGFIVVSIGNADKVSYQETIIRKNKDIPLELSQKLRSVLSSRYIIASTEEEQDVSNSDVTIVIGLKKPQ